MNFQLSHIIFASNIDDMNLLLLQCYIRTNYNFQPVYRDNLNHFDYHKLVMYLQCNLMRYQLVS